MLGYQSVQKSARLNKSNNIAQSFVVNIAQVSFVSINHGVGDNAYMGSLGLRPRHASFI